MNIKDKISIKFLSILFAVMVFLYGLLFYIAYQLNNAGKLRLIANSSDIFIAKILKNLPFSNYIANEFELDLMLAYHILHQNESDYIAMMSHGGEALKMYREVEEKSHGRNQEYSNNALLEICNTLVRMPWSEKLKELAEIYADKLHSSLINHTIDAGDEATAHENLAIFFSRTHSQDRANYHASVADSIDSKQFKPTIANTFIFLRHQRMALGACISGGSIDNEWSIKINPEISEVISQDFLRKQYYHSWDVALVKTATLSSKEESCKQLAVHYQNLF